MPNLNALVPKAFKLYYRLTIEKEFRAIVGAINFKQGYLLSSGREYKNDMYSTFHWKVQN